MPRVIKITCSAAHTTTKSFAFCNSKRASFKMQTRTRRRLCSTGGGCGSSVTHCGASDDEIKYAERQQLNLLVGPQTTSPTTEAYDPMLSEISASDQRLPQDEDRIWSRIKAEGSGVCGQPTTTERDAHEMKRQRGRGVGWFCNRHILVIMACVAALHLGWNTPGVNGAPSGGDSEGFQKNSKCRR